MNEKTQAASKLPNRDEIDSRYKWRLDPVYVSDDAWEKDLATVEASLPRLESYRGRLGESADTLLDFLTARDRILEAAGRLSVYAHLKRDEDTRAAKYQGMSDRIARLASTLGEKLSYVAPELIALDAGHLDRLLASNADLRGYRHHIDDIVRVRKHTLSPREEEIVAMTSDMARGSYQVFSMLDNADLKFPTIRDADGRDIEITKSRYTRLLESPDRRVRHDTYHAFMGTYEKFKNTLAAALSSQIKRAQFYARVRRYESTLHAALDANNIPVDVFRSLTRTVDLHLEPLHRYMSLRKRHLQLDELHPYDTAVPLVPQADMHFEYEEAARLVRKALEPMGEEYGQLLDRAFNEGWIDVFESAGKRSGAYSGGSYGTPPYLLLNFNGTLDDVFTLAHELGHSLHSYLSQKHQPFVYSDYTIFVAEVASTVSESLLTAHLLAETRDRDRRLYLLNHWVDQIRGTFYTQVMFAQFEQEIHRAAEAGEPLTHESLSKIFGDLYLRYHGADMVQDEVNRIGWGRIPHFYYNFYVYQYATGYAAAAALSGRILKDGPAALKSYLEFLSAGSSAYPIDLLRKAGVEMTRPDAVVDTIALVDRLVGEMDRLLSSG